MKKVLQMPRKETTTVVNSTCREALELSKKIGVRIHWRPHGVENWMLPELDLAQVLEG